MIPRLRAAALAALFAALLLAPAASAQTPEQTHVTLAPGEGVIVHFAVVGTPFTASENPLILWRVNGGEQQQSPAELVGEILPSEGTASPADAGLSTYVYAATLPVEPGATVSYMAGSGTRGYTAAREVRNVPAPDAPLRFLAYGDIGVDNAAPDGSRAPSADPGDREVVLESKAHDVRDLAVQQNADLLIIPGDLAYRNGRTGWDTFMRFMEPVQSRVPTMPVAGNHEYADAARGYDQFLNEYVLPDGGAGIGEHHYSFQAGPVTFIGLNTDNLCGPHDAGRGPPQDPCQGTSGHEVLLAWLEAELAAAAADDATPWTVVYFHHPLYSWGRHGDNVDLQFLFGPLFDAYGVDVVVNAHDHVYGRTYPVRGFAPVVTEGSEYVQGVGPVYVVTGGGGRGLYDLQSDTAPAMYAHVEAVHHLTVWDVTGETLTFRALRSDGTEMDGFVIARATAGAGPAGDPGTVGVPGIGAALALVAIAAVGVRRRRL